MLAAALFAAGRAFVVPPEFPPIPLAAGVSVPGWSCAAAIAAGFAIAPVRRVTGCLVAACGLGVLFMRDQHWIQPWAWQAFLLLLTEAAFPPAAAVRWQRRLAVSVYVFSAVSKLDVAFSEHTGRLLLTGGLAPATGLDPRFWGEGLTTALTWSLPVGELAAGMLLTWRPAWGVWAAAAMHAGLLLALGPWGLDHHPGVLIWNVFFAAHVWALFGGGKTVAESRRGRRPIRVLAAVVLLLPALEPLGLWDHWPSWSVYSNRPAVVRLEVWGMPRVEGCDYVAPADPLSGRQIVSLSGWSFETWRTPIYPQERFQLAAAAALLDRLPPDAPFAVRVLRYSPLRTGESAERVLQDRTALKAELSRYWLNTAPSVWTLPDPLRKWAAPD